MIKSLLKKLIFKISTSRVDIDARKGIAYDVDIILYFNYDMTLPELVRSVTLFTTVWQSRRGSQHTLLWLHYRGWDVRHLIGTTSILRFKIGPIGIYKVAYRHSYLVGLRCHLSLCKSKEQDNSYIERCPGIGKNLPLELFGPKAKSRNKCEHTHHFLQYTYIYIPFY